MIDYLQYFLNPSHLFSLRPPLMTSRAVIILAVIFGLCIVTALVLKFVLKTTDSFKIKSQRKAVSMLGTMGILGYVYLFFAWQGAALLSARFWLLLWLAVLLVWAGFIIKYLKFEAPKKRAEIDKQRQFQKYIP